jgi:hypothetical protein
LPHVAACEAYLAVFHAAEAYIFAAYQFKTRGDYAIGSTATPISAAEAGAAIGTAERFIDP